MDEETEIRFDGWVTTNVGPGPKKPDKKEKKKPKKPKKKVPYGFHKRGK